MDAASILRDQLAWTHGIMEQAVADLTPEQLHHRAEGTTIRSIAVIYSHAVQSEDWFVNSFLRHEPTQFDRGGWAAKTRILPFPAGQSGEDWAESVRNVDFAQLRAYAQEVYAATDDYLGTLSPSDLDRTVVFGPLGEMPVGVFLGKIVAAHASHHAGEVCALKGVLGLKGLPF